MYEAAQSIHSSFHQLTTLQVNGSACSQNSKLINGILKDELGFQGFVVSDWLAQIGGVSSALAGLDMAMPGDGAIPLVGSSYWGSELSTSILNGTVPVDRLNDMVRFLKLRRTLGRSVSSRSKAREVLKIGRKFPASLSFKDISTNHDYDTDTTRNRSLEL